MIPEVGSTLVVHMPGMSQHKRVVILVEVMSKLVGKVRFGDGSEAMIPFSKLR